MSLDLAQFRASYPEFVNVPDAVIQRYLTEFTVLYTGCYGEYYDVLQGYYVAHMLAFLCLIVPIAFFWTFIGSVLAKNKISWLNQCNLQKTASIVLLSFSIPLSYSALLSL